MAEGDARRAATRGERRRATHCERRAATRGERRRTTRGERRGRRMGKGEGDAWRGATSREGANRRAGRSAKKKEKEKKTRTGVRLAFVSGKKAQRARVKFEGQPTLAFASERGSHIPAEKRKTVSRNRRKKRRKETNQNEKKRRIPECRQGGGCVRKRRARRRVPVRKGWGVVVSQEKGG